MKTWLMALCAVFFFAGESFTSRAYDHFQFEGLNSFEIKSRRCNSASDCYGRNEFCRNGYCTDGVGDRCYTGSDCTTGYCRNGRCSDSVGDSCSMGSDCATGYCLNERCLDGRGERCSMGSDCPSGTCVNGRCY